MVRAPCCEKMGLKKGPWSPEEDQVLINYIQTQGHSNWRALPKHAGLLRCGKSCRLRWTNYLRPDIKRGNFTREEEDTIIKLHEMLGNRWSAIAARLPGRTDNEIKNVWHTHLKKRLPQGQKNHHTTRKPKQKQHHRPVSRSTDDDDDVIKAQSREYYGPLSPAQCSSDISTLTTSTDNERNRNSNDHMSTPNVETLSETVEALDEDFWSEVLSADNSGEATEFTTLGAAIFDSHYEFPFSSICDGFSTDFWYDEHQK